MKDKIKIGTRGSPLALAQVDMLLAALQAAHPHLKEAGAVEIVKITTSGDMSQAANTPLMIQDAGGKALFAREIEDALLAGTIDCAVHSMKDMPPAQPEGLYIPCLLPRGDARDVFISRTGAALDDLPPGAVVGTSSPRRQAIILAQKPDLKTVTFRGNVGTRLEKLAAGTVDATVLAAAGLARLGLQDKMQHVLEPDVMLPAAGQGTVGIEIREGDAAMQALLAPVHCRATGIRTAAERAFIAAMDGSCRSPLAAYMTAPDPEGRARLDVLAADEDGGNLHRLSYIMHVPHTDEAERLGRHAAQEMKEARRRRA